MNPLARNIARTQKVTADNGRPADASTPRSDQTPQPDRRPGTKDDDTDAASGDEGIDEPAHED